MHRLSLYACIFSYAALDGPVAGTVAGVADTDTERDTVCVCACVCVCVRVRVRVRVCVYRFLLAGAADTGS